MKADLCQVVLRITGRQAKHENTLLYFRILALRAAGQKYDKVVTLSYFRVLARTPGENIKYDCSFIVFSSFRPADRKYDMAQISHQIICDNDTKEY
jgi:hypothetical protein